MMSKYNAPQIEPTILNSYLAFTLKTLKDGAFHAMARDSNETIEQRVTYEEFFIPNNELNYIFIDDVGYSICVQRSRRSPPKGEPPIAKLPLSKTPNC